MIHRKSRILGNPGETGIQRGNLKYTFFSGQILWSKLRYFLVIHYEYME